MGERLNGIQEVGSSTLLSSTNKIQGNRGDLSPARDYGTNSNAIESALSLLKRSIYGTFHSVDREHLYQYVAEFDFRWNARRAVNDGARLALAVRSREGKRLRYREPSVTLQPTPAKGRPF